MGVAFWNVTEVIPNSSLSYSSSSRCHKRQTVPCTSHSKSKRPCRTTPEISPASLQAKCSRCNRSKTRSASLRCELTLIAERLTAHHVDCDQIVDDARNFESVAVVQSMIEKQGIVRCGKTGKTTSQVSEYLIVVDVVVIFLYDTATLSVPSTTLARTLLHR